MCTSPRAHVLKSKGIDTDALRVQRNWVQRESIAGFRCIMRSSIIYGPYRQAAAVGGLFTIADHGIGQSVLERSEPGLVVPPLEEPLADNRLADLL